jgi:hypothetical protein
MDNNNAFDNDIYLEIADLSKDEEYFRLPVYNSESYDKYENSNEVVIPLTAYYYNALKLCIVPHSNVNIQPLDEFIDLINNLWFLCDRNNVDDINSRIRVYSNNLRNIIRNGEKTSKGIYLENLESFNLSNFVGYFSENVKNWYKESKNKKIIDDFNADKGSCVAIAIPLCDMLMDKDNCYLSLSGAKKDYKGLKLSIKTNKWIEESYTRINDLLEYVFSFRFIECHLTDETRRYTYLSSQTDFKNHNLKGNVLVRPVKFINEYEHYIKKYRVLFDPFTILSRNYSCCEKKILNYMNFVNRDYWKLKNKQKVVNILTSYEFRIQKKPCRMCRPVLIGCYHIGYYYYDFNHFLYGPYQMKQIAMGVPNTRRPLILK